MKMIALYLLVATDMVFSIRQVQQLQFEQHMDSLRRLYQFDRGPLIQPTAVHGACMSKMSHDIHLVCAPLLLVGISAFEMSCFLSCTFSGPKQLERHHV